MSGPLGSSQWMYSSGAASIFSHTLDQSLRFEDGTGSYLRRDITSSSNMRTWTWSAWVKRGNLGSLQYLFTDGKSSSLSSFNFTASDELYVQLRAGGQSKYKLTNQVFRDVSAWYHFVWRVDTTQATDEDRSRVYVNGTQITSWSTEQNVLENTDSTINQAGNDHQIGGYSSGTSRNFDGYMAEVNFVDGISYGPENFGETSDGVWIPKQYTGSYGTNGFHLDFSTSSFTDNVSDPDVFADQAGSNDFNAYNVTVYDILSDSPTNNWCVLNRLKTNESLSINQTFSEGNLDFTSSEASSNPAVTSTFAVTSGKWYWEVYIRNVGNTVNSVGIASNPNDLESDSSALYSKTTAYSYQANGQKHNASDTSYGDTWTTGDIISVALDLDAGAVYFYKNGTIQNSGTAAFTGLSGEFTSYSLVYTSAGGAQVYNFGQDDSFAGNKTSGTAGASDSNGLGAFYYSVPSGYNCLCASNLPDITIGPGQDSQADDNFDTLLYTGDGNAGLEVNGLNFQPDFLWIKRRDALQNFSNALLNSVTGATKGLISNRTSTEFTSSGTNDLQSFDNDGFTIGPSNQFSGNDSGGTFVAWSWKAGGSASSNSNGSITSSVSANQDAGFSIVSYTGTGSNGTIGHGLSSPPEMIIIKARTRDENWLVYHKFDGGTDGRSFLNLNLDNNSKFDNGPGSYFQDTPPTSSVFHQNNSSYNQNTDTYIAYCFHSVDGYSKVGSYVGNGSAAGTFVYTGLRPAFVLLRVTTTGNAWFIYDNKREGYNELNDTLSPNYAAGEDSTYKLDLLSNGFKIRSSQNAHNQSGQTFLYLAFAEAPLKFANAR